MAHDMTIEEIIHQLAGHENRRAYYSGYDDKYARADLREAEKGIKHCTALLNQRIAAMNEAMAILREVATEYESVPNGDGGYRFCPFCGHEQRYATRRGTHILHAPDCLRGRIVRLLEGA